MKQIIGLSVLFDMSIASLSKIISQLNQAGLADSDKCRAVKKSIEGVERSIEKLQNLKTKVKKLDPNKESLNNIKKRVSQNSIGRNSSSQHIAIA